MQLVDDRSPAVKIRSAMSKRALSTDPESQLFHHYSALLQSAKGLTAMIKSNYYASGHTSACTIGSFFSWANVQQTVVGAAALNDLCAAWVAEKIASTDAHEEGESGSENRGGTDEESIMQDALWPVIHVIGRGARVLALPFAHPRHLAHRPPPYHVCALRRRPSYNCSIAMRIVICIRQIGCFFC